MKCSLLPSLPGLAHSCLNFRPDFNIGADVLVPALPPRLAVPGPWRVIGAFARDGEVVELMVDGQLLAASVHEASTGPIEPYIITNQLDGRPVSAYDVSDGFMVLTDKQMYHIVWDENGVLRAEVPLGPSAYPTLMSQVSSEWSGVLSVDGFKLGGTYGPGVVSLVPDDGAKLDKAVAASYRLWAAEAVADGAFVAPVMVRYRLFDAGNRLLFESVPKLHVPTGRHDAGSAFDMSVDLAGGRVLPGRVSAAVYRLSMTLPGSGSSAAGRRVARLEVQLSPQFHRVDLVMRAANHLTYSGSAGDRLTVTLPGCADASGGREAVARRVRRAMGRLDSLFETVLTVDNPFEGSAEARSVDIRARRLTVDREVELLERAVPDDDSWLSRCRVPHAVTGTVGIEQAEVTLLGNLSVGLYEGARCSHFVNSGSGLTSLETVTAVSHGALRCGVATEALSEGYSDMALSPVIAYPDPEATSIKITVRDADGNVSSQTFELTRCGRYACYIDPGLRPVRLVAGGSYTVPRSFNGTVRYQGHLLSYSSLAPMADVAGLKVGNGRIGAIHPVARQSGSAWEGSRARFHVMGDDGIMSVALSGHTLRAPIMLDRRRVTGPEAVVTATGGDGRVYALAGGDLVVIDGNKVRTLATRTRATMLAWVATHGELLAIRPGDGAMSQALVYWPGIEAWAERQLPPLSAVYTGAAGAQATSETEEALYDLTADVESPVRCSYETPVPLKVTHKIAGVPLLTEVVVDLTAASVSGTVTVSAHNGHRPGATLSSVVMNGRLEQPVAHRLLMPRRTDVVVTLDALLSADAVLKPLTHTESKFLNLTPII